MKLDAMSVSVRRAGVRDVRTVAPITKDLIDYVERFGKGRKNLRGHFTLKKDFERIWGNWAGRLISSGQGLLLVGEVDGEIAGYSFGYIKMNMPFRKLARFGYIDDIYVMERYRGLGLSSRLKAEMLRWFRKKGIRYVSIELAHENRRARAIYRKWGFEEHTIEMRRKI